MRRYPVIPRELKFSIASFRIGFNFYAPDGVTSMANFHIQNYVPFKIPTIINNIVA